MNRKYFLAIILCFVIIPGVLLAQVKAGGEALGTQTYDNTANRNSVEHLVTLIFTSSGNRQ